MKTSVIRVISYDNKVIRGILSNPFYVADMEFTGMLHLALCLKTYRTS